MARLAYLCAGEIVKPQGLRGELKVMPATDDAGRFLRLKKVYIDMGGELSECAVTAARLREGFAYIFLQGVESIEAAEVLRGKEIYVKKADAPRLPSGRYFIAELLGCKVQTDGGETLGELCDIVQSGGNDVYTVKRPGGGTVMFPAVKDVFESVDIDAGVIVLREKRLGEVAVYDD